MSIVSIVIPCRNESGFIRKCLESVLNFTVPEGVEVEIFIIDGESIDNTVSIVEDIRRSHPGITILNNPGRYQSFAINIALDHLRGDKIMRLDAHAEYPENYLRMCLETASRTNAENVGGVLLTAPGGASYEAHLVQALTTHAFGVGDAGFRTGAEDGVADTVPYGFFDRSVFEKLGRFDERLIRAQDYEFNRRIIAGGGKVWRSSEIEMIYFNQPTLSAFYKKQLFKEAPYNVYLWYLAPYAFAPRHAVTGVFAFGFVAGCVLSPFTHWIAWPFMAVMALYFLIAFYSAFVQAVRYRKIFHFFLLPGCFFLFHLIHGIGIWIGFFKLITGTAPVQKIKEPWPGAGKFRAYGKV